MLFVASAPISGAPIQGAAPACPVGAIADKSGAYCCPAECKTCGGPKCELKGSKCCRGQIKELCTTTNSPLPCFNPPGTCNLAAALLAFAFCLMHIESAIRAVY
eukprot:10000-Heterococcus_DN1.PRE.1